MTPENQMTPTPNVALLEMPVGDESSVPKRKIAFADFIAQTSNGTWAEWVEGEIVTMTVANEHTDLTGFLLSLLRFLAEANKLGRVFFEPFIMKTGADLPARAPDVFFVGKDNLVNLKKYYFDGPADLVIEVISTESRARDRGEKYYEYEEGGVREYWLIDPQRKQVDFYQLGKDKLYHTINPNEDGIYHSQVMPGLWLKVDWLWQEPLPELLSVLQEWKLI